MERTTRELVLEYVAAASSGDVDRLAELVHPDAVFGGTVTAESRGRDAFVQGFRNLSPIVVRSEVRQVIAEGDRAAVLYDFVTDTDAGAVLCAEFVTFDEGRITSSTLLFDWRHWPEVLTELQARAARASASTG